LFTCVSVVSLFARRSPPRALAAVLPGLAQPARARRAQVDTRRGILEPQASDLRRDRQSVGAVALTNPQQVERNARWLLELSSYRRPFR
jgi:hypothetical protein